MNKILDIKNLSTSLKKENQYINLIDDISFYINEGESLGIVGESGCGKSLTSLSIMGLTKPPLTVKAEKMQFNNEYELQKLNRKQYKSIRAKELAMIFQEPMTALNPVIKIGKQIEEVLKVHTKLTKVARRQEVLRLINQVGIPRAEEIMESYPHQLSGGMRQRIMIAIAIACKPKLLIADEPTTALDVTIQAQILELIKDIQKEENMSLMLITHDLGVVNETCNRVVVMYAGRIVELGNVKEVFESPLHPYTQGLLASLPQSVEGNERLSYIKGNVPQPQNWSKGCRFADRCQNVMAKCHNSAPHLSGHKQDRKVACWLYESEEI